MLLLFIYYVLNDFYYYLNMLDAWDILIIKLILHHCKYSLSKSIVLLCQCEFLSDVSFLSRELNQILFPYYAHNSSIDENYANLVC